jgi:hypothetical protein
VLVGAFEAGDSEIQLRCAIILKEVAMALPGLPKLPKVSQLIKKANPVREIDDDLRQTIKSAREEISSASDAIKIEGKPFETPFFSVEAPIRDEIKGGTAGNICSDEHVTQTAFNIAEALRMARGRGVKDAEVRRRLKAAWDELNQMERYDLVAEKIATYPQEQQKIGDWLLPRSSAIRHSINEILMKEKGIEDLEKVSAYASSTARASELTDKIDALPAERKAADECLEVKGLKTFIKEQRIKKGSVDLGEIQREGGIRGF